MFIKENTYVTTEINVFWVSSNDIPYFRHLDIDFDFKYKLSSGIVVFSHFYHNFISYLVMHVIVLVKPLIVLTNFAKQIAKMW